MIAQRQPSEALPADSRRCVCQLVHSLHVGGAEILARRLGEGLADRFRMVFACLDERGTMAAELVQSGYTVEVLRRGNGLDLGCARRLARFLGEQQVDIVHAHQYTPFFYAAVARLLGRRRPILFTEHGRAYPDYPRRKRVVFNKMMLRRGDRLVAVGEQVRQALVENERFAAHRIETIYNGVNLQRFAEHRNASLLLRQEFRLPADAHIVMQVARLDPLKDHHTALAAVAALRRRGVNNVHLVMVGDGPLREAIVAEIERQNLADRVHLLGLRSDVPALLREADAFLLTSVSEGIPLTLIEAMAARVPIVSTDVGGVREVVQHEETALLCPAGDAAGLASALQRVLGDPSLRARLCEAAAIRAETHFAEQRNHEAYAEKYSQMIERGNALK